MLFRLGVKSSIDEFYNYRSELSLFIDGISDNITRLIVVKGIRRIGKSSLVRVGCNVSSSNCIFVDVRAYGFLSVDRFYELLSNALTDFIRRSSGFSSRITDALSRVKGISVSRLSIEIADRRPSILVEILSSINKWAGDEGIYVVVVFDEAQDLVFIRGFRKVLAYIYDYLERVKIVLTGSEVGVLDRLVGYRDPNSPLYGRAYLEINLRRLHRDKAIEFLELGFREQGFSTEIKNIVEAVDSLDGVIGWLTYYGYYTLKYEHEKALKKTISDGSIIVAAELRHFLANRMQARDRYRILLKALDMPRTWSELKRILEINIGRKIHPNQFTRYLRELVNYGFIVKENNLYRIADPLIKYALRHV